MLANPLKDTYLFNTAYVLSLVYSVILSVLNFFVLLALVIMPSTLSHETRSSLPLLLTLNVGALILVYIYKQLRHRPLESCTPLLKVFWYITLLVSFIMIFYLVTTPVMLILISFWHA